MDIKDTNGKHALYTDEMKACYEEGRQSYYASHGDYRNPYPVNGQKYNAFEAGWKQAAGLHPNVLREHTLQRDAELRRTKDQEENEMQRIAEAYRKAKGRG